MFQYKIPDLWLKPYLEYYSELFAEYVTLKYQAINNQINSM